MEPDLSTLFPNGPPKGRPCFKRARRLLLLWVFGNKCFHCHCDVSIDNHSCDHLVPKGRGGSHLWWNLVASCSPCNHKKGHSAPSEEDIERCKLAWARFTNVELTDMLFQSCNALGPTSLKKSFKIYNRLTKESPCQSSYPTPSP